ncbi:MAG: hypothetical protein IK124_04740 [Prevotella sp.]|nr:hypothetical protein [Prevotella sp.]
MKKYNIINNLPIGLDFYNYDKKKVKLYSDWFVNNKLIRVEELTHVIVADTQFKTWRPDYSEESLTLLSHWFLNNVERELLSENEYEEKKTSFSSEIHVENWDLSLATYSKIMDVGIYLGDTMIFNNKDLKWEQYTKNKRENNYGHMVIKIRNLEMNPIWLIYILAIKIAKGVRKENGILEIYQIWCNILKDPDWTQKQIK